MKTRLISCLLFGLLVVASCNNKGTPIVQDDIAHDGSSKVWISTEYILDGAKQKFDSRSDQFFLVLQADGKCMLGMMAYFDKPEMSGVGKYEINADRSKIKFFWNNGDVAEYGIVEMNEKRMIFEEAETKMRLVFEPYSIPEATPPPTIDVQPGEPIDQNDAGDDSTVIEVE
jgi:hypothetical protein